jgi:hypothetical protein
MPNKDITDEVTWGYDSSVIEPCSVATGSADIPGCFVAVAQGTVVVGASERGFDGTIFSDANATITIAKAPTNTAVPKLITGSKFQRSEQ